MSDERTQTLLRAVRSGDDGAGAPLLLALHRRGVLMGADLAWRPERVHVGPRSSKDERVEAWRVSDGFRCPECDAFKDLGERQAHRYREGAVYTFRCCPEHEYPAFVAVDGDYRLGDSGPLSGTALAEAVGPYLVSIETAEEREAEEAEEEKAEAHEQLQAEDAALVVKIVTKQRRLQRWRDKLTRWDRDHAGRAEFPGDGQKRSAIGDEIAMVLDELAAMRPEPETPGCLVEFKARLCRDHHLESLWLDKCAAGVPGLTLDLIIVEPGHRGGGHGERALASLCEYADRERLYLALTPSSLHGSSVRRLRRWYGRHGFKKNKGGGADFRFRDTMLREPK